MCDTKDPEAKTQKAIFSQIFTMPPSVCSGNYENLLGMSFQLLRYSLMVYVGLSFE